MEPAKPRTCAFAASPAALPARWPRRSTGKRSSRGAGAAGPTFAHAMTKKMLLQEWNMGVDEAIEAEAQAQAICMATNDFHRAYHAFAAKEKPVFEGD